ncbi:MAG: Gfo/Idh/MocA family protein, partial [Candidatus Acidiferrales bacterium]
MTYRAGIVGCGRIGCGFDDDPRRGYVSTHAGAYACTPGVELAALCDLDEEKLERYGEKFCVRGRYIDCARMFEQEKLDIVSICTLSATHIEIARAAVKSGVKAIFCEKPIAENLSAADEMIRLCAEHNVLLLIDHQRRFAPLHQRVAAFLRDGGLGRVQQATCYYTAGVANTGTHLIDLLRFYLGDVKWVEGRISANASSSDADPNIDGWLGFADGSVAAIQACDVRAYSIFEIQLLGTKGRLHVTSHGFEAEFEEVRDSERYAGYRELFPASLPINRDRSHEVMLS